MDEFWKYADNKHSHKRPSMILIHSYEMSNTGKSETESKLDFSDSGTTPLNCMLPMGEFYGIWNIPPKKRYISAKLQKKKVICVLDIDFFFFFSYTMWKKSYWSKYWTAFICFEPEGWNNWERDKRKYRK